MTYPLTGRAYSALRGSKPNRYLVEEAFDAAPMATSLSDPTAFS